MRDPACLALLVVALAAAAGADSHPGALHPYSAIEVEIENQRNEKGQKIPDEFVPELRGQILHGVVNRHVFRRVEDRVDEAVAPVEPERVVLMKVRVVGYTGAKNAAGVKTVVHFIDKATGQEVFSSPVNAQLHFDPGALTAALRKLGRSIGDLVYQSH